MTYLKLSYVEQTSAIFPSGFIELRIITPEVLGKGKVPSLAVGEDDSTVTKPKQDDRILLAHECSLGPDPQNLSPPLVYEGALPPVTAAQNRTPTPHLHSEHLPVDPPRPELD